MSDFKLSRLVALIAGQAPERVVVHKDTFLDFEDVLARELSCPVSVTTSDLRFTRGRRDGVPAQPGLVVYACDSHDPQAFIKHTISGYIQRAPVVLVGDRQSVKRISKQLTTAKRFYSGDLMACLLVQGQHVDASLASFEFTEQVHGVELRMRTQQGLFSCKSLDAGTEFLLEQVRVSGDVLDFACGYGPIGVYFAQLPEVDSVTMSDSCLPAVACARENVRRNGVRATVVASYLLEGVHGSFDAIVSNPPTHTSREEVQELLRGFRRVLRAGGEAFLVVNQAVDYERDAQRLFGDVSVVGVRENYKLLRLADR